MIDMRNRPRKNTPHHVKVIDNESGQVLGRLVDITCNGMMIVANQAITPGRKFMLRMNFPTMIQNRSDILIESETVWCNQDQNPRFFRAGFKFCNLTGENGYILEEVMHKFSLVG